MSRLLNDTLLRGERGFNGLIVSDASGMAGLGSWADRATLVPEIIANRCDMLLSPASSRPTWAICWQRCKTAA